MVVEDIFRHEAFDIIFVRIHEGIVALKTSTHGHITANKGHYYVSDLLQLPVDQLGVDDDAPLIRYV